MVTEMTYSMSVDTSIITQMLTSDLLDCRFFFLFRTFGNGFLRIILALRIHTAFFFFLKVINAYLLSLLVIMFSCKQNFKRRKSS